MEGTVRASGVQMSRLTPLARHDSEMRPLGMTVRGMEDSLVCSNGISACTPKHGDMPLRGIEDTLACSGAWRLIPLSTPNGRMQCIINVSVLRGNQLHAPEHAYHHSVCMESGWGCLGVSKLPWAQLAEHAMSRLLMYLQAAVRWKCPCLLCYWLSTFSFWVLPSLPCRIWYYVVGNQRYGRYEIGYEYDVDTNRSGCVGEVRLMGLKVKGITWEMTGLYGWRGWW